jgi:uridine phosphorylase
MSKYFAPSELIINADGSCFHLHLKPEQLADKFMLGKEDANTIIMHVDETLIDKEVQKWIPWAQVDFK